MGDREARILGAGDKITVGEKEYSLRPVVAKHLCDLEREALRHYKKQYLTTFSDNASLLENGKGDILLVEKMEEAARWTLQDLPQRNAYDTSKVPVTEDVKKWVKERFDDLPDEEFSVRALLTTALDQGSISAKEVKKLSGRHPTQGKVRYDQWWITACMDGMISFIVSSVQLDNKGVSREDVQEWSFAKIAEAARKVEAITSADMGNT